MRSPILNLCLLGVRILYDLGLDINYKNSKFSKVLPKKCLKFDPSRRDNTVKLNLDFILLPARVDLILGEERRKRAVLRVHGIGCSKLFLNS